MVSAARALIVLVLSLAAAGEGAAQSRLQRLDASLPLVTRLPAMTATPRLIAEAAAPFLWPSSAEISAPRALPERDVDGPEPFDAETPLSYYYAIREMAFATPSGVDLARKGTDTTPLPIGLTRIDIRYFFYFPEEAGDTAHLNDLESAELWLLVQRDGADLAVYLWQVFGAAHGLSWSTNGAILSRVPSIRRPEGWPDPFECGPQPEQRALGSEQPILALGPSSVGCRYRPVLFVEEGKHATAPDLNRDGSLTPMIDLNKNQSDAWGVRDSLGTDSRVSPAYGGDMFVPRRASAFWVTDAKFAADNRLQSRQLTLLRSMDTEPCSAKSEIYLDDIDAFQDTLRNGRKVMSLDDLLDDKEFCRAPSFRVATELPAAGVKATISSMFTFWRPRIPYGAIQDGANVAFRVDRGMGGVITLPLGISPPFIGGWLVFKLNLPLDDTWLSMRSERGIAPSFDMVFMSSATRKVGLYGGGEWEWARERDDFEWREPGLAWEIGFKVRTVETKNVLWSGRIGYRFNGTQEIRDQRFVAEFGIGAW